MENKYNLAFVLDLDGIFTDSKMYYTEHGKFIKSFGSDDWDLIKHFSKYIPITIISADHRGFEITRTRVEKEMNMDLHLVKNGAKERWEWIKNKYPDKKIIFMGDSLSDCYSLKNAFIGITVVDALPQVKAYADIISTRRGADRAVAEIILQLNKEFSIFDLSEITGLDQ